MKKITFKCEVITPMFIAGADGKTPELRPPSIKGALRFWWRALNGHLSLDELRKQEAEIFGASDEKIGKSKVTIKIGFMNIQKGMYYLLPHKNIAKVQSILPHSTFEIIVSLNKEVHLVNDNKFTLKSLKNLFIVFSILGGVGKRVRRGFGSFRITHIDNKDFRIEEFSKIFDFLSNISPNYKLYDNRILLKSEKENPYPFLKTIEIGQTYSSYETLLKKIGESSHKYDDESLGYAKGKQRFASPVFVSIQQIKNEYYPIISTLNTVFPNRKDVDISKQEKFKEVIL